MSTFEQSHEIRQMAARIIAKHHPHMEDALDIIGFYLKEGADWDGKCRKATSFERHMTGELILIFIGASAWREFMPDQRLALVDHQLTHIWREPTVIVDPVTKELRNSWADAKEPDSWSIRDHDVEEFADIIMRHGLWDTKRETFGEAVRLAPSHQMNLADAFCSDDLDSAIRRVK